LAPLLAVVRKGLPLVEIPLVEVGGVEVHLTDEVEEMEFEL
jgi:hypothetical protein